jgi:acetyl-CoA synthetase
MVITRHPVGNVITKDPQLWRVRPTGTPKAATHVHGAVVAHHATAALALDLHPTDVFWCTADPGWVTETSYGGIGPPCRTA